MSTGQGKQALAALGRTGSWPKIVADLDSLTEDRDRAGRQALRRPLGAPSPAASPALPAVGVALPPTVRSVDET